MDFVFYYYTQFFLRLNARAHAKIHAEAHTRTLAHAGAHANKKIIVGTHRKPEHSDGSVLSVREQGARRLDDVLRRIYGCKKIKGFKETLKSLPQSKPLNSVSLLELINTSTGIN